MHGVSIRLPASKIINVPQAEPLLLPCRARSPPLPEKDFS